MIMKKIGKGFAALLGVNLSEMFNDSCDISYLSSDERELIECFRKLSDEKSKLLLKIASEFCNN